MTAIQSTEKPDKPYPEFPLFAHDRGYWCKKFKGKQYNCGPWADPDAALNRWYEIRNDLQLGVDPRPATGAVTIDLMVNAFLDAKDAQVQIGELMPRTFQQYKSACAWLKANMGEHRLVDSIGPADFQRLRAKFPQDWTTTTITNQIVLVRTIFAWAYNADLIEKPVKYGDNFSKPSAKRRRLERAARPAKEFSAKEVWTMLAYCKSAQLRAMIWLGLNCGYGNLDCSRLRVSDVHGVWLDVPRGKTGEARRAWLWPETRAAIKEVLKDHDGGDLLFLTCKGLPWTSEIDSRDALAHEFKKLKDDCGCDRKGVGFYALRHMFETHAGETKDQIAVDHVMGHVDPSMAAVYREGVSDARIRKVCQHVRDWFVSAKPKRRAK